MPELFESVLELGQAKEQEESIFFLNNEVLHWKI